MNYCKSSLLIILFTFFSTIGFSQFRNWERFEFGLNYVTGIGQYSGVSPVYSAPDNTGYTHFVGDTTAKRLITTSWGAGVMIGTCIPFKKLGHESLWAISLELEGNLLDWEDINQIYNQSGSYIKNNVVGSLNAYTYQIALPFGIEYKVGTDAIKTQRKHLGASFGAGAMLIANGTYLQNVVSKSSTIAIKSDDEHNSGFNYGFDPYVKAELAVFAGMCFKLRAMASYGPLNYLYENQNVGVYSDGPFRITGLANITLSLIVIPKSRHWSETNWWNTYDTYNPYDKLH